MVSEAATGSPSSLFGPEPSESQQQAGPQLKVQHIRVPQQYISARYPLTHAAISPDGMDVAVAGIRGLGLYSRRSSRWRLFGDVSQEREILVQVHAHTCYNLISMVLMCGRQWFLEQQAALVNFVLRCSKAWHCNIFEELHVTLHGSRESACLPASSQSLTIKTKQMLHACLYVPSTSLTTQCCSCWTLIWTSEWRLSVLVTSSLCFLQRLLWLPRVVVACAHVGPAASQQATPSNLPCQLLLYPRYHLDHSSLLARYPLSQVSSLPCWLATLSYRSAHAGKLLPGLALLGLLKGYKGKKGPCCYA